MHASIQLWSLRSATEADGWTTVLDRVAKLGFRSVEPYAINFTAAALAPELKRLSLAAPTSHGFLDRESLAATLDAATLLGVSHIVHPHLDRDAWQDTAALDQTAEMLEIASAAAAERGMTVGIHNHEHELTQVVEGQPALFALMDRLSTNISIEFDIYWAAIAGVDPIAAIRRLTGRIRALHVKDGPFGATAVDQVALGEGGLFLDDVLAAVPDDTLIVLSLDRIQGTIPEIWTAVETSRSWLTERAVA